MTVFTTSTFAKSDATNTITLTDGSTGTGVKYNRHQIAIDAGDNTSGTITVLCTPKGAASTEAVYENGSALVINLATSGEPETRTDIKGIIESFAFTFASLGGSDTVTITISSWIE